MMVAVPENADWKVRLPGVARLLAMVPLNKVLPDPEICRVRAAAESASEMLPKVKVLPALTLFVSSRDALNTLRSLMVTLAP